MKQNTQNRSSLLSGTRQVAAVLSFAALLFTTVPIGAFAQSTKQTALAQDQRIIHVLNRLGFGARPGDVERVKAMGLDNYIRQQLHPEQIQDEAAQARVSNLQTLSMSTPELYAKYPQPGRLIKQLERQGRLPASLANARQDKTNSTAQQQGTSTDAKADAGQTAANSTGVKADDVAQKLGNKDYQKALKEYYVENNLRLPQAIIGELQASRIIRGVYSERQLQEVMVNFWENHFNVFAGKGADKWLLTSYDRDTIRPHTLGKFSDLLVATAESPAMLFYLDNFQSVSPNAQAGAPGAQRMARRNPPFPMSGRIGAGRGPLAAIMGRQQQPGGRAPNSANPAKQVKRGINENYARELMELHTLGVDGGYTQKDVQEVARCFTGWTIYQPQGLQTTGGNASGDAGKFFFNPRQHDNGEKTVLGQKIPAGGGMNDGLMVLDILARNPATAKFIATKLCRHFVMDNPSPALVARVSSAYLTSGGDIRNTLMSIFTSPEFNSPEAYRAKVKTPFELAVSSVRALGGDTNGAPAIHQWISKMGQPLYGYQTPNGYADVAEAWVNTGSLLQRINFGLALASNRISGTRVDLGRLVDSSNNGQSSPGKQQVLDRFADIILQGNLSETTKATLLKQLTNQGQGSGDATITNDQAPDMGRRGNRQQVGTELARADIKPASSDVTKIVGLLLGSPEFQRQ